MEEAWKTHGIIFLLLCGHPVLQLEVLNEKKERLLSTRSVLSTKHLMYSFCNKMCFLQLWCSLLVSSNICWTTITLYFIWAADIRTQLLPICNLVRVIRLFV